MIKWKNINSSSYDTFDCLSMRISRSLGSKIKSTVEFLRNWLDNSNGCLRKDYKELVLLALLYLNGISFEQYNFTVLAPGAYHHARWMMRIIYTVKIALFQSQLKESFDIAFLKNVSQLALYLCVFYIKWWLCSPKGCEAPQMDLILIKELTDVSNHPENYPKLFQDFALASRSKVLDHTWYLSERLLPFSLFSEYISDVEKESIRKALLKCRFKEAGPNMCLPLLQPDRCNKYQISDFVGPDSWTFLYLMTSNSCPTPFSESDPCSSNSIDIPSPLSFLNHRPSKWNQLDSYIEMKSSVLDLPVVNDAAERALGLLTEFHTNTAPKDEEQKQFVYKVVKEMRQIQSQSATGSERVTKHTVGMNLYNWS